MNVVKKKKGMRESVNSFKRHLGRTVEGPIGVIENFLSKRTFTTVVVIALTKNTHSHMKLVTLTP